MNDLEKRIQQLEAALKLLYYQKQAVKKALQGEHRPRLIDILQDQLDELIDNIDAIAAEKEELEDEARGSEEA